MKPCAADDQPVFQGWCWPKFGCLGVLSSLLSLPFAYSSEQFNRIYRYNALFTYQPA